MKKIFLIVISAILTACGTAQTTSIDSKKLADPNFYAATITQEELKKDLFIYASDEFEGRETGEPGQKMAVEFLKNRYIELGIPSPIAPGDYYQDIESKYLRGNGESENVLAFIKGTENPNEVIVISAHLDHIGKHKEEINNGADDDGSGTVAILEMAEAFKMSSDNGYGPKRSILFLHVTGEEKGLLGSKYYTNIDPVFPLEDTVCNLNIDMIGRTDPNRKDSNRNYIYLIGSDKLSSELHTLSEKVNENCCQIDFDYTFNDDNDPNRFYYRSDHYNFAKNNIPVIFYFSGTHEDYHKPTDTPDKIEYDLLENRTRLIFHTAWELANRTDRIAID